MQGFPPQEVADSRRVLCATIVLDRAPDSLQQRVANKLHESCRAGSLEISNFPDYKHLVAAVQNIQPEESDTSFQVCVKKHDKLQVLSVLANKFLENEDFRQQASQLIEEHNSKFNEDGDFMADPEPFRTTTLFIFVLQLCSATMALNSSIT